MLIFDFGILKVKIIKKCIYVSVFSSIVILLPYPASRCTLINANATNLFPYYMCSIFILSINLAGAAYSITIATKSSSHCPFSQVLEIRSKSYVKHFSSTSIVTIESLGRFQILKPLKVEFLFIFLVILYATIRHSHSLKLSMS